MSELDDLAKQVSTSDTKKKLVVGQKLIHYLSQTEHSLDCEDLGSFIDALVPWMQSSNFKVSQNGLDIVGLLVERLTVSFKPYVNTTLGAVVDRLGDAREIVREKAHNVLDKLMQDVIDPQQLFEKMSPSFLHKNGKVREEILNLFQRTLNTYGSASLIMSRFLPSIVTLLSDPTASVRDAASNTLVEIYRHAGERVRADLLKKHNVPPAKLSILLSKFDQVKASGDMPFSSEDGSRGFDEADRMSYKSIGSAKLRSSSVPANRRHPGTFAAPKPPTDGSGRISAIRRNPSVRAASLQVFSGSQAGAVDEELFIQAFEDVKSVCILSGKSLQEDLTKIKETLSKTSNDWKVRIDALQFMRALLMAGANSYEEMTMNLKTMELPFISSVKDLRSQVVREACITIAYMSQQLRHKVDRFLEALVQNIINLIPNSAKVMSTSGIVCMRFIIQNTHSPRLIPILTSNIQSKSRDIRRYCCEFLDQMLHTWPTQALEKHLVLLQDAIKKGIADADPDARSSARKAYWGFADHFKEQADGLLNSLEGTYRRMLQGGEMSNSSSSNSLNLAGRSFVGVTSTTSMMTMPRSRKSSITSSQENLHGNLENRKMSTLMRKSSGIPLFTSPIKLETTFTNGSPRQTPAARSNSAIDASAVRRANVRAQYAQRGRMGIIGASLPRPRKSSDKGPLTVEATRSATRSRSHVGSGMKGTPGSVSHSQPGSRSTSPTSLKSYHTYFDSPSTQTPSALSINRRRSSGIPRSTGPSREGSPGRKQSSSGKSLYLRQSREAENAFAEALKHSPRKRNGPLDDGSDESETSSICSEKSFEYGRRGSDFGMWADSRERLHYDAMGHSIEDIIANCASTHWADRKDGLIGLQYYFRDGKLLSATELRRVTEIFTRMFMDAHTKVFTLFLDTLSELIVSHKDDLGDWLHVLVTKLLNKQGADLLGSIIQKINRTLEIVRESFPYKSQLAVIFRYLIDTTQTPNSKVKIASMNYLKSLVQHLENGHSPHLGVKEQEMALAKIIAWTYEPKSSDVRKSSQAALVSLFSMNSPHFTGIAQQLPKMYQENVTEVLSLHMSASTSTLTPGSPPKSCGASPMKPRSLLSPNSMMSLPRKSTYRTIPIDPVDDSENLNPEDIRQSLRSTANAIQNYSFDTDSITTNYKISSLDDNVCGVEDKLAALSLFSADKNGGGTELSLLKHNKYNKERDEGRLLMESIIGDLECVKSQTKGVERRTSLTILIKMTRENHITLIKENFRTILRLLLENISCEAATTRALVFAVLTELLKQQELISSFQGFTELIILKALESHRDKDKDVERAAESSAAEMAGVLPADTVIRVLDPIIKTGDFPVNQAAIKMMTKVAEHKVNKEIVMMHLADLMPGLLKAYDNVESSVRKASVFCMVALHQLVGEDLQPHLASLNGSKLKLLNLYIKRAQAQHQQTSMPASPRSCTPP